MDKAAEAALLTRIGDFLNNVEVDLPAPLGVAVYQSEVTQHVDQPRNASRMSVDSSARQIVENGRIAAGYRQTVADVGDRVAEIERRQMVINGDPLHQLDQFRTLE